MSGGGREAGRFLILFSSHARQPSQARPPPLPLIHLTPLPRPHTRLSRLHTFSISVTFKDEKDNSTTTVRVPLGVSLLEAAHRNDVDLEGACEGSLACSTCHVILEDPKLYALLPEPDDDENDMLDLAYGLTETSRLGCQVKAAKELDGLSVVIPAATRNFAVDGHIPKPH